MTDFRREGAHGLTSASPVAGWVATYARGLYTDVVRGWQSARATASPAVLLRAPEVAEAVGWSLALTKAWEPYADFRADLLALGAHRELLGLLDAWHAIQEGRYDAGAHAAGAARCQALVPGSSARLLAHALKVEGVALFRLGRYREAETLSQSALQLFAMAGDRLHVSQCATNLGLVLNACGDLRAARAALVQAVDALLDASAAEERIALARVNLAVVELHLGRLEAARALYEECLVVFERLALRSEQITARNGLGQCARAQGRFDAALAHHRAALRLAGPDLPRQLGLCHEFLGRIRCERGEFRRAEAHYQRALEIAGNIAPDGDLMLEVSWQYAELLAASGRADAATPHLARAEALCAASGERRELGCVQRVRARLLAAAEDAGACAGFETAFDTLASSGRVLESALTLIAHADSEAARADTTHQTAILERAGALLAESFPDSLWRQRVERRLGRLRAGSALAPGAAPPIIRYGFVTRDRELTELLDDLPRLAASPHPVLLEGETGTGKELIARALHHLGSPHGAWVALNCAAVPRDLFESELFGHVRGSFSGAAADKPGLFEQADGGTLFLDEIGEMPLDLQSKLLRVLDDGQVRRIGEVKLRQVRVRIIAATNRALEPALAGGTFRADLYHRLAVHALRLKPLRERPGDIEALARHFLAREQLESALDLTPELLATLEARPWTGNARELRNELVRRALQRPLPVAAGGPAMPVTSLRASRSSHERRTIEAALAAAGGSVVGAARSLHLHVTTLRRKMRALGIERPA